MLKSTGNNFLTWRPEKWLKTRMDYLLRTSETSLSHKLNASDLAMCIEVLTAEKTYSVFVFVSLWMKCLQFPSGFLIANDQFKTLCQTQIRGPYGPHLHVSPSPCQKCTCVFRIPLNGPLWLNLKCNFNC